MKYEFAKTYGRPWAATDGEPFTGLGPGFIVSSWPIELNYCDSTHPPFLLRSLSMIEAAAQVANEQAQAMADDSRRQKEEILKQEGSVESQIALEQLREDHAGQPAAGSQWSEAHATIGKSPTEDPCTTSVV
jgi:hypothetical protein